MLKVEKLSKKVTAKTFFKIFLVSIPFFLVSILFKKVREEKGGGGGGWLSERGLIFFLPGS